MKRKIVILFIALTPMAASAAAPDCSGIQNYPASMALSYLINTKSVTADNIVGTATQVTRLASNRVSADLYRQIYYIVFKENSGKHLGVITISDASPEECSMGDVELFVIRTHVIGYGGPNPRTIP